MRLWSLHPRYLDAQGLVALWREGLLAQAVLRGATRGYQHHPQLARFRAHSAPTDAIAAYLRAVHDEATARGYRFDRSKVAEGPSEGLPLAVTSGQIAYEWQHLLAKLARRSPALYERWREVASPDVHTLFVVRDGLIEPWERA